MEQVLPPLAPITSTPSSLPIQHSYRHYEDDNTNDNDNYTREGSTNVKSYLPGSVKNAPTSTTSSRSTTRSTSCTLTLPYSSSFSDDDDIIFAEEDDDDDDEPLPVLYTNDPRMVNRWLVEHVPMDGCAIGFDTESVPDAPWIDSNKFKGRPVTVQLATPEGSIVISLIRNNRYSKACLPLLEAVLGDENIVKCGCSIDDDMLDLKCLVPGLQHLEAKSRFDLGLLGVSKNRLGLKTLTSILLNRKLEKPKRLAVSDWSRSPLTDEQIAYGARDAWAGAAVLEELKRHDPETFGTKTLVELLQSQPTLKELYQSRNRRKQAKKLLSQVTRSYQKANSRMPVEVKQKVHELRAVLRETQMDLSNNMQSLGFIPEEVRVVLENNRR